MINYEKIIQECYWDYNITADDLIDIIKVGNKRELKKIFSKIIYNSNDKFSDLRIFKKDDLKEFFDDFKVTYNDKYITRHILVLRSLLLGEKHKIKGLEWTKQ